MRIRSRISLARFAVLALFLLTAAPAHAARYMTPGFMTRQTRPMSLVVLPPHAEFIKAKAIMTDEMVKESAALEDEGARAIVADLTAKGYAARSLASGEIASTPGLADLVKKVNDRFGEEWPKIVRRPKGVRKGRYTVGDDVARLASVLKVDGLVLARIQAVTSSGGRVAMSLLLGAGGVPNYARLDASVLDGKQGRVECFTAGTRNASFKDLTESPGEVMTRTSKAAFKKYPEAGKIFEVKEEDLAAMEMEADEGGEGTISDFEALLGKDDEPAEAKPEQEKPQEEKPPGP